MEEKFHSKKNSHSRRVSTKIQCIRPEFRSVLLSFFLCGISFPYIYFYGSYFPLVGVWGQSKSYFWRYWLLKIAFFQGIVHLFFHQLNNFSRHFQWCIQNLAKFRILREIGLGQIFLCFDLPFFRCSYLGHRSHCKLNMARFEESKDGPSCRYIETWVLKH